MEEKSLALLKIHLRRALIHVQKCTTSPLTLLDVCGEAGDLFFLLQYLMTEAQHSPKRLTQLLQDMLGLMTVKDAPEPLALSKRELMLMAETLEAD
jgi:hypothetical protein